MDYNKLDYEKMSKIVSKLMKKYAFMGVKLCGKSVMGRDILCIRLGKGDKKIFLNGAHHSLEWITSSLLLNFCEDYADALKNDKEFFGHDIINLYERATFFIMPMVNPDGVDFVLNGINKSFQNYQLIKFALHGENIKKVWQANANGVDLNHNYDADFEFGKELEKEIGINGANYTRYSGEYAFSEPETCAVRDLVEKEKFDASIAFHSQGEVIYWDFNKKSQYKHIAEKLSQISGYELDESEGISSVTGFKDWVLDKFNLPAFTVEVGLGKNPISFSQFDKIKQKNYKLITECCYLL